MVRTDSNGERYLSLTSVSPTPGTPVRPLLLTNRSLIDGIDPTGLLVTIYGWILYADPEPSGPRYVYIDDGSNVALESQPGVKVILDGLASPITKGLGCDALLVTGIMSLAEGENGVIRVIRPRGNADIITIGDSTAPSVPTNLAGVAISATQVNLTWTASTDNVEVTGYRIYRDSLPIGTSATTAYADVTCQPNTSYLYKVSAYDLEGSESALSTGTTVATPPYVDVILDNPSASFTGVWQLGTTATGKYGADYNWSYSAATETATATWRPTIGIRGHYAVYCWYPQGTNRSIKAPYTLTYEGAQQTVLINQQAGGGQWIELGTKKFSIGTTGNVKLGNGTAEASNVVVIADAVRLLLVSTDVNSPSIPTGFTATATGPAAVYLSWTASTDNVGVAGYNVYRAGAYLGNCTTTNYTDTGLSPSTTYSYQVSAYDAIGNESYKSATRTATTPAN